MARDLRPGHREAHRAEQPPGAPVPDVPLGLLVGFGRRGPDDVEPELVPSRRSSSAVMRGSCHARRPYPRGRRTRGAAGRGGAGPGCRRGRGARRLRAASLNHLDVWVRRGLPSVPKPRILGADGAGVIETVGVGVDGLYVGQRVVLNPGLEHGDTITVIGEHRDGTHAELIAIADAQVFPLDDGLSFEVAAAFPLVYETAYRMLVTRAAVQEDEWALIWGIGGGVATAAFEICRALGVRTIVTSGDDDKLARAVEWGADVASTTRRRTSWRPCGRRRERGSTSSSRRSGRRPGRGRWRPSDRRVVSSVCGATSGPNPPAQLHRFWWKQLTVLGSRWAASDFSVSTSSSARVAPACTSTASSPSRRSRPARASRGRRHSARSARDPGVTGANGYGTAMVTKDDVVEALHGVEDPELGMDIVELGLSTTRRSRASASRSSIPSRRWDARPGR